MLKEFIDFVEQLFPCIDPYKTEQVKKAIKQFDSEGKAPRCFLSKPFDFLAQGDIIDGLPFDFYNSKTEEEMRIRTKGILLSNTCDAEREANIMFAPLIDMNKINIQHDSLKKNLVYQFLYFPPDVHELSDYAVDFSLAATKPGLIVRNGLKEKRLVKLKSLNSFGYYLFLCKLTIYLMRPEDLSVVTDRKNTF